MSFWKLAAKTLAAAPTDGINGILAPLKHLDAPSSAGHDDADETLSVTDIAAHRKALDALLTEPDLLSEIKSGSNQRLTDFLARKEVVLRLGGWVVWGLGRGFPADPTDEEGSSGVMVAQLESGILPDEMEAGRVPDEVLQAAERRRTGMGGVPHLPRPDQPAEPPSEDADEDRETELRARANFPRLCAEILVSTSPSLSDALFRHEAACTKPRSCPQPEDFLLPFWESVLGSTEAQLISHAQQIGFWARVNANLLEGPVSTEVLEQILRIPHLPSRLLSLLPTCTPLNDVLLLLLRVSRPPSPLIPTVVVQAIRMLDPFSALGRPGHTAAEDLLRGIIELCIAVPRAPGALPSAGLQGGPSGPSQDDSAFEWRDTTLARHIADEKSVRTLLDWSLAEVDGNTDGSASGIPAPDDDAEHATPKANVERFEPEREPSDEAEPLTAPELRTSSLLSSLAVLIDLIRKNNSDFVEQQMLSWARRRQIAEEERQILEAEGAEAIGGEWQLDADERGPSVVDLGAMLSAVAHRLPDFQRLLRQPRTSTAPRPTASGLLPPLTLERFRICELYAELLHCSNMSLLNRSAAFDELHDASGHLARGWQAVDDLAAALAVTQPDDGAPRPPPEPPSPRLPALPAGGQDEASGEQTPTSENGVSAPSQPETATGSAEDRRQSNVSHGTASNDERELPPTPSVYSETSRSLPVPPLSPGPLLKTKFVEHLVIPSMIDLFFDFPWNNFLHSVVFDVLQQIFQGRLDRTLDRQLAESVFVDGHLCERILRGQQQNDEAAAARPNMRLGYMGHLCLISEAVVKLFERHPDLAEVVAHAVPQPAWDDYVATTLRQARERDLAPLSNSGGLNLSTNKSPSSSSLSDEDDEFPMNSARTARATDTVEGSSADPAAGRSKQDAGAGDQFSRYLADELASDRTVGSSDEDDEDDGWFSGPRRLSAGDGDFSFDTSDRASQQFGFDDRFEEAGLSAFRANGFDSDEDADWAPFDSATAGANSSSEPAKASTEASSGFSSFESSFDPTPSSSSADADDFGDFEGADAGPSIVLPSMDQFEDFDLGEESRIAAGDTSGFGGAVDLSAVPPSRLTEADGSDRFGRLSLGDSPAPASPAPLGEAPELIQSSEDEDLGPALHPGAHLTEDGQVEAEIEGKTVRVPADDIIVTTRRNSMESRSRSNSFEGEKA